MLLSIQKYIKYKTPTATLAFFRLAFGLMMAFSLIRFASYGWIEKLYILPEYRFTYYGFSNLPRLGNYTYLLFIICFLSAIFFAIGYKYKLAIITFFISFTYIELLDKTTYLNHYYFVSVVSFILIFLPANRFFSVDSYRNAKLRSQFIPKWNVDILKIIIAIVYIYAGLAKINSDWLLEAMPLKIWLPGQADLPIIGSYLNKNWVHYLFSWTGMIYDVTIPFLLLYKPTRYFAFFLVVVFHVLTKVLFPIGIFPYVMILSSMLFFDATFHTQLLKYCSQILKIPFSKFQNNQLFTPSPITKIANAIVLSFLLFQIVFPFRYMFYKEELFWTEQGYRFSWRVMLMEKAGYTQFTVVDSKTNKKIKVTNSQFLTEFQIKQMAFQPDFILEYAQILKTHYLKNGVTNPKVFAESYVALNGRLSRLYIDPKVDLAQEKESFKNKNWILPFNDTIYGF